MPTSITLRIRDVEHVTDRIAVIVCESMAGIDLPAWEPGAHIEVILPSGLVRHYSLCGDPQDRSIYRIGVLRDDGGRGGSVELHRVARPGGGLEVRAPRNNFPFEEGSSYLFLAGGIGITPIVSMIGAARAAAVPWRLVYGGRSRHQMAFLDRLAEIDASRVEIFADDAEGRPDFEREIAAVPQGAKIYACGPEPMLNAVSEVAESLGRLEDLRIEHFSVKAVDTHGEPFEVELARSGITVPVAADETILTAVLSRGITVPYSCENGYCGTCEAVVLEGDPDHRDTYLTDEEKDDGFTTMICVSRCHDPRLVVDL